jgi:hypothetical protein
VSECEEGHERKKSVLKTCRFLQHGWLHGSSQLLNLGR